jgi:hypothetical protein
MGKIFRALNGNVWLGILLPDLAQRLPCVSLGVTGSGISSHLGFHATGKQSPSASTAKQQNVCLATACLVLPWRREIHRDSLQTVSFLQLPQQMAFQVLWAFTPT